MDAIKIALHVVKCLFEGGLLKLSEGNVRVIRARGLGRLRDCVMGTKATS